MSVSLRGRLGVCGFLVLLVTVVVPSARGQGDGLYADFTTSLGSFTCQLDYTNAPRTVANFIGLATGQRRWLDLLTGRARTNAFYDGLTFHRVIAGFVIQGGSPNGQGTDGPGYAFPDEFSTRLTFSAPWVLAMANSGPDSNGSQFFITVAPFVSGNNTYAIFGRVTAGTNVVAAINQVATNASAKPLTNVFMQQVAVRRVGPAAQAFDLQAQGLPIVTNLPQRLACGSNLVCLSFSNRLHVENRLYSSARLNGTWTGESLGFEVAGQPASEVAKTNGATQGFYRFAQVQYASSTFAPRALSGRTLTLNFASGLGTLVIVFDAVGGGSYSYSLGGSGTVASYVWTQEAYRGFLWPIYYSGLSPMTLRMNFKSAGGGSFSGTIYSTSSFAVSGTFTLAGP